MAYVGIFHAALPAAVNLTPTITVLDPINYAREYACVGYPH